jgi:hypothetical protein
LRWERSPPSSSFDRCELAVCNVTPAAPASSVAVNALPTFSANSMFDRAGSPISEAMRAMSAFQFVPVTFLK